MRYSIALAALSASSVVIAGLSNELPDGQVQQQVSASTPAAEATAYSTIGEILTSCAPTVKNCPASKTPPVVPVPIVTPTPSPNEAGASSTFLVGPPVYATPASSPVVPVPGSAGSSGSPKVPVPVVPVPVVSSSPAVPVEVGTTACPTCPSCTPVTVYSTVTATPTPAAAGSSGSPGSGSGSGAASPSGKLPPTPGSPVSVPAGGAGAGGAAAPSGTATASASTGAVIPPTATGSPIATFKGAASTVSSSMAVAGLAALAAVFLA